MSEGDNGNTDYRNLTIGYFRGGEALTKHFSASRGKHIKLRRRKPLGPFREKLKMIYCFRGIKEDK